MTPIEVFLNSFMQLPFWLAMLSVFAAAIFVCIILLCVGCLAVSLFEWIRPACEWSKPTYHAPETTWTLVGAMMVPIVQDGGVWADVTRRKWRWQR